MIYQKYLYSDITEKIIGCAMKVHNKLGSCYREEVYQRCLAIEMTKVNLNYSRELEVPIYYDKFKVDMRRMDFLVEKKVVVELKEVKKMDEADWAQTINNLESSKYKVALLINFGTKSLKFKRFINTEKNKQSANSA